jgi:hypothetical protein
MADIEQAGIKARRLMEQPTDAIALYSDYAQILATEHEVVLQFYETIPRPPDLQGNIAEVTTRLRATVVLSPAHALNVGKLLLRQLEAITPDRPAR